MKQLLQAKLSWRIPVTIVGGFAGAGKTTLLRHALLHNDGRHIVAIVRDVGELEIDARLIKSLDGPRCVLHNGSVCLSAEHEIETSLLALRATLNAPEHVLVEAPSGLTNRRSAGYAFMPGFRPAGTVAVVSAMALRQLAITGSQDSATIEHLRGAELIVMNQLDRVPASSRPSLRHTLLSHVIGASFVEVSHGRVPLALLIGIPAVTTYTHHATIDEWTPTYELSTTGRRLRVFEPRTDTDYRAWQLSAVRPIDRAKFREWANALPEGIVRGDGILQLRHDPAHRYRFTLCGARWWLEREGIWNSESRISAISLVGLAGQPSSKARRDASLPLPLFREVGADAPKSNGDRASDHHHSDPRQRVEGTQQIP